MFRRRSAFESPLRPPPPEIRVNHLPVTDYCTVSTKQSALIRAALQQRAKGRSLSNSPIIRKKKFHHLPLLLHNEAGEATLSGDEQAIASYDDYDYDNGGDSNVDYLDTHTADIGDGARHSRHHVSRRDHTRNVNSLGNSLGTTRYNRLVTGLPTTAASIQSGQRSQRWLQQQKQQDESALRAKQYQQQQQEHQAQQKSRLHHPLVKDRRDSIATSRPTSATERSPVRECILVRRRSDFTDREYQEYLRQCKKQEYEQQYPEQYSQKQTHLHPHYTGAAHVS